jgi:hypothetical protein
MLLVHSKECQASSSLGGQVGQFPSNVSRPVPLDERNTAKSRVKSFRKEEKTEKPRV